MKKPFLLFAVTIVFFSCTGGSGGDEDVLSSLMGTFAFDNAAGSVDMELAAKDVNSVDLTAKTLYTISGTLTYLDQTTINSGTFAISGEYDSDTGSVTATASGSVTAVGNVVVTIVGTFANGVFQGVISRTINGVPGSSGTVTALDTDDPAGVLTYLGTIGDGVSQSGNGSFNLVVDGDNFQGSWFHHDGIFGSPSTGPFTGTRSGTTINTITIYLYGDPNPIGAATGSFLGDLSEVSGTWTVAPNSGEWIGYKQ
jgi:hypothetical protein